MRKLFFILSTSPNFYVFKKQRLFVNIIIYTTKICKSFSHKILFLCILPIFIYFNLWIRVSKVLSGSAAWQMAQENIVPSAKRRCRTELLTPESYQVKSSPTALSLFHLLRNHTAQHPASGAQGKNSGKIRCHICNAPVYRQ